MAKRRSSSQNRAKSGASPRGRKKAKGRSRVTEGGIYARPEQGLRLPKSRPSNDPADKPKRRRSTSKTAVNLPPREAGERLQKLMAAAGVASRRECEQFILEGRVQVDGNVVRELGVRVDPFKQEIAVDGEKLARTKKVYFAVNKPDGVVCTARDPSGRPRVTDLLPPDVGRVFNVGRLDMASEGLILLTNDGELANQLTHPRHGVEKIYHVQVQGHPTAETLGKLRKGVYLAEGKAHFVNAKLKSRRKNSAVLEVILDEGRNREIRRVLARVGHKVQRLTRIAVGPIRLADLPPSAYRPLTAEEVRSLRNATSPSRKTPKTGKAPSAGKKSASSKPRKKASSKKPATATTSRGGRTILGMEGSSPKKKQSSTSHGKRPKKKPTQSKRGRKSR